MEQAENGSIQGSLRSADGAGVVRLDCRFEADLEDVWSALTQPDRLGQWLGDLEGDLRTGGEFRARFFATGWDGTGQVETCEPMKSLRILTRSEGEPDCTINVALVADGEATRLVIEDCGLPLEQIAAYGAGDHVLVEELAAHLAGRGRCDAGERWRALHPGYQDLAASLT